MDYQERIDQYNSRKRKPRAHRCALLIIDMQEYFNSIASPILENTLSIINACRAEGIKIFYTRHGHRNVSYDGGMLGQWWGDLIPFGSNYWQIIDTIAPQKDDTIIDKNRYSAFYNTKLDETLRSHKVEELIITGVLTNCCCETTARDAFVRDYRVFFTADATATVNDDLHTASLMNLAYGFAHIITTDEICHFLK
ncbi:MAG: isochorismatase family protein [bacterium]|nr:isochorismatase family protein [bacterium]